MNNEKLKLKILLIMSALIIGALISFAIDAEKCRARGGTMVKGAFGPSCVKRI